ncbi:MAG TPA: PilT/PilU family type 4a pilus ATPase [Alcanivoracaceae bacterium]|nr:PilT/PilU family type 4a pilus ATPase [Alcanivoracaceae bacterium]
MRQQLEQLLKIMDEREGTDLFITVGVPPTLSFRGTTETISETVLTPEMAEGLVHSVMTEEQKSEFLRTKESNFAINIEGVARFRISAFYQRDLVGMVVRRVQTRIPTIEELGLRPIVKELIMEPSGLIIFVGPAGSGKSTSLAALLGYRNAHASGHIITVEDPIEFVHEHDQCIVTQREVSIDTESYEAALKNTLRQAPDVVYIGEIRSAQTMEYALAFAETGHLCVATMHASSASQAVDRVVHFFPTDTRDQFYLDLSRNLKAVVVQKLIPDAEDTSKVHLADEILLNTPLMAEYIRKGETSLIQTLMGKSTELGMRTMDQALFDLFQQRKISYESAILHANSSNDLRLMIKLAAENEGGVPLPSEDQLASLVLEA